MKPLLISGITIMLLTTGTSWGQVAATSSRRPPPKAPEIDAASGTNAIALLTGVLLLAAERSRSRRSQNWLPLLVKTGSGSCGLIPFFYYIHRIPTFSSLSSFYAGEDWGAHIQKQSFKSKGQPFSRVCRSGQSEEF